MINNFNWEALSKEFTSAKPFNNVVIDNFFKPGVAEKISEQFPAYNDPLWYAHDNVVEVKKLVNHWDRFPAETYQAFTYMNSDKFLTKLKKLTKVNPLYSDHGLSGGGWHIHKNGGKLNIHKDYSLHPKLGLWRKLNLIIYLSKDWKKQWGGALEFWSHDEANDKPLKKVKSVDIVFNRAVIFDTTQNSWHGLPLELKLPDEVCRKSLAVYYLTDPTFESETRKRALFVPTEKQEGDKDVETFIKKRAEWKEGKLFFSDKNK